MPLEKLYAEIKGANYTVYCNGCTVAVLYCSLFKSSDYSLLESAFQIMTFSSQIGLIPVRYHRLLKRLPKSRAHPQTAGVLPVKFTDRMFRVTCRVTCRFGIAERSGRSSFQWCQFICAINAGPLTGSHHRKRENPQE